MEKKGELRQLKGLGGWAGGTKRVACQLLNSELRFLPWRSLLQ